MKGGHASRIELLSLDGDGGECLEAYEGYFEVRIDDVGMATITVTGESFLSVGGAIIENLNVSDQYSFHVSYIMKIVWSN